MLLRLPSNVIQEAFTGRLGSRRRRSAEDDDGDEEESCGEVERPEVSENGEELGCKEEERDEDERENDGKDEVVFESEKLFWDLHGLTWESTWGGSFWVGREIEIGRFSGLL